MFRFNRFSVAGTGVITAFLVLSSQSAAHASIDGAPGSAEPRLMEVQQGVGASKALVALVYSLIEVLDEMAQTRVIELSNHTNLQAAAESLCTGYVLFGLDPDLTTQECQDAFDECAEAIGIIDDHGDDLDLPAGLRDELRGILNDMKAELDV